VLLSNTTLLKNHQVFCEGVKESLSQLLVLPEEVYPLDIKFSEVDWRDVGFVGNYYQSYPGIQFEKVRFQIFELNLNFSKKRHCLNMM